MAEGDNWRSSFWDCWSPSSLCLKVTFLPCFVSGHIHHRLSPNVHEEYKPWNTWCMSYCFLGVCGCNFLLQYTDREELRKRNNLSGTPFQSAWRTGCFPCCDLAQSEKELDALLAERGSSGINVLRDGTETGYQRSEEMVAVSNSAVAERQAE